MILEIKNLVKTFPGIKALQKVNFQLEAGEIHALLGDKGAGKSTVIKVLTGVYPKDSGSIKYQGEEFEVNSSQEAEAHGISTVYQEVNLLPNLSVAENIFMERQPKTMGIIRWKEINNASVELLKKFDLSIDVTRELGEYSIAVQQMIAIARTLNHGSKVIILDEPTSSLNQVEAEHLFKQMRRLKEEGCSIILITHFLDQVYQICDKITVLKDGQYVGMWPVNDLPMPELISKISGKEIDAPAAAAHDTQAPTLTEGMDSEERLGAYDIETNNGAIVRFAGLLESGDTELVDILFDITEKDGRKESVRQRCVVIKNPRLEINNQLALISEYGREQGLIGELSLTENIILALQVKRSWFNLIGSAEQKKYAEKYLELFSLEHSSLEQIVNTLSSVEQQKVILARWIASNPALLLVDEPTRGINIGAKREGQKFIISLSQHEVKVVVVSEELEARISCSERVSAVHAE